VRAARPTNRRVATPGWAAVMELPVAAAVRAAAAGVDRAAEGAVSGTMVAHVVVEASAAHRAKVGCAAATAAAAVRAVHPAAVGYQAAEAGEAGGAVPRVVAVTAAAADA
jgi:hypothetical protein